MQLIITQKHVKGALIKCSFKHLVGLEKLVDYRMACRSRRGRPNALRLVSSLFVIGFSRSINSL